MAQIPYYRRWNILWNFIKWGEGVIIKCHWWWKFEKSAKWPPPPPPPYNSARKSILANPYGLTLGCISDQYLFITTCLMLTQALYFMTHYLSKCHHFRIYLGPSPWIFWWNSVFTPVSDPKGVLMTPQVSCIDVCIMPTAVWFVLSHYLSIIHHCRIYLGHFSWKNPKTGVSTPGFGPKRGRNDRKDVTLDVILMWMDVVDFLTHYLSKFHHFGIYLGLSP